MWALLQVVFAYIGPAFGAVAWAAHISVFGFGIVFALLARRGIARRLRKMKGYLGPYNPSMSKPLYKIVFHNHGKVYELYARRVAASGVWDFPVVGELGFHVHAGVCFGPTEQG